MDEGNTSNPRGPEFDELEFQRAMKLSQNDQNGPGQRMARVYTYLADSDRFTNWDLICFSAEYLAGQADVLHWLMAPTSWVRCRIYMAHYLSSAYSWLDQARISPSGRRPERGSKGRDTTDLGDPKFDELYIQPLIELVQNDQNGPGQRKARVYTYLAESERFTNWDLICFSVEYLAGQVDVLPWLMSPTWWVRRLIYMAYYLTSAYSSLYQTRITPWGPRPPRY